MKQTEILTHATHVNGWEPAVYMSYMSQNLCLFLVSNLSILNFSIFSAHVSGVTVGGVALLVMGTAREHRNGKWCQLATLQPAGGREWSEEREAREAGRQEAGWEEGGRDGERRGRGRPAPIWPPVEPR